MYARFVIGPAFLVLMLQGSARADGVVGQNVPAWTYDARWYRIEVAYFRNGETSNDPEGVQQRTNGSSSQRSDSSAPAAYSEQTQRHGGDLQGLQSQLPYLKKLGVNALLLSSVFAAPSDHKFDPAHLRHVDDSLAVAKSLANISGETHEPGTWRFSPSDRLFLSFVKEAHKQGFRVVVESAFGQASRDSRAWQDAITRRWMDPDGDGDPSDGIDGWAMRDAGGISRQTLERRRAYIKTINREGMLIAMYAGGRRRESVGDDFDFAVDYRVGHAIRRFFSYGEAHSLDSFFNDLAALGEGRPLDTRLATITVTSSPTMGRLLSALRREEPSGSGGQAPEKLALPIGSSLDRWRLATVFGHLYMGAPMTYYGDEVGMCAGAGADARAPMWWSDLPGSIAKGAEYRGDFLALTRLLHDLRERFRPLRRGNCRTVLLDERRRILAFARTLPGDEVIVVMNYGDAAQRVTLAVGWPGQLIGMVTPELRHGPPHPLSPKPLQPPGPMHIPTLRLGGNRQFADDWGDISLSIKPWSVRLLLVRDKEPR